MFQILAANQRFVLVNLNVTWSNLTPFTAWSAVTKNIYSCHSLQKKIPQFTETNPSFIYEPSKQTLSNVIRVCSEHTAQWPLTRPDVIYTANAWQKSLNKFLLSLFVSFFLFLMHIHANTHAHNPMQAPSQCIHTNMHAHTHFTTTCTSPQRLSCCGYLHHKQLQDTGGPLMGKCACHK